MKRLLALTLCIILILTFCACKKANAPADADETDLYKSFLNGEVTYKNSDGAEFYITDFDFFGEETEYALYDMNGDDTPELLVKMTPELHTFTLLDNQVKLWRSDTAYNTRPLNNGCMLYEHHGDSPEHTSYIYYVPDFYGNTKYEINFSYWKSNGKNPEWYDINGEEVSKEIYEAITEPIFEIGDDKIEWKLINGKPSPKNEPINNAVAHDKTSTPTENTAAQEQEHETMAEKLIRVIEAKYEEELDLPENHSNAGMCSVSSRYTEKWKEVSDHCYNKIMSYNGIVAESEEFYSADDLHTFVSNMKKSWELYYQEQCENYEKALATIYSKGSVVGPIFADYQYEMQKEWALQLVYICQHIGLDLGL